MIYILEDDESIRKLVEYTLRNQSFECQTFERPSELWKALEAKVPTLLLLDIMLPEEDGISVLKKIRANTKYNSIYVIMISAKGTEFDIVTGLDTGADDYITKPFGMMNLVSRIKAVLRRSEKQPEETKILEAGSIKMDIAKHTVFVDSKQVFLTVKEFDLLSLLIENRGTVLTREQLLNSIWNIDAKIESRTVDVHVRTLRQKIGDNKGLIETIRGVGYIIN